MPRTSWSLLFAAACGFGLHAGRSAAQETASFPRALTRKADWTATVSPTRARPVVREFDPTVDDDAAEPPARAGRARVPYTSPSQPGQPTTAAAFTGEPFDAAPSNRASRVSAPPKPLPKSAARRVAFSPESDDDDIPAPPRDRAAPGALHSTAARSGASLRTPPPTAASPNSAPLRDAPGRVALGGTESNLRTVQTTIEPRGNGAPHGSVVAGALPLSLEALQETALRRNPTLAQAQAGVRRAQGQVVQAGLYPNPTAGYQANEVGNEGYAGQQGYFIEQEFVTANKLGLSQQVARQDERRAQYGWRAQHLRVVTAVRREFYAALVATRREELARQLVEVAGQSVKITEARLKREEGTRVEVLHMKIEHETARQTLIGAENARQAAWRRLEAVVGQRLDICPLAGDPTTGIPNLAWDDVWHRLCAGSPVLGAARADAKRAQAKIARARVEPIPNVIAQNAHGYDTSTEYHIANIQIGVAIPVFNRNQGNIRSAEAEWVQACREVERLERSLQRRLADVYRDYATALGQAERYRTRILPDVNETLDATRKLYEAGELGYLQLQVAQRTYTQTNLQYTEVLGQLWENAVALEGLLLTDGLASPESLDADAR